MAEDKKQEPSMEEILASIRRIISDDDSSGGDAAAGADAPQPGAGTRRDTAEADGVATPGGGNGAARAVKPNGVGNSDASPVGADDDVLELTEVVRDDGTVEDLGDELVIEDAIDDDNSEPTGAAETALEAAPAHPDGPDPDEASPMTGAAPGKTDEQLVSDTAAEASAAAMASLVRAVEGDDGASPVSDGGKTVEQLVREVLRPLLKDWLDQNLPPMVERIVRQEIRKIVRRAED